MLKNFPKRSIIAADCCFTVKKDENNITNAKKTNGNQIKFIIDFLGLENIDYEFKLYLLQLRINMQTKKLILLVALSIAFVTTSFSQRRGIVNISNGIGIGGGLTQFDIETDNFETKKGSGWIGGLAATLDLPHRWYTVSYGMQVSESNIEIMGRSLPVSVTEPIEYKLMMVQAQFLFHAKLAKDYLMIDGGPMIQYNSELELKDETQENYLINGYTNLTAKDISDISKFNINASIGATVGFSHFKLRAQYIYGLTNMLNKLNNQNLDTTPSGSSFKGNQSMLAFMAFIYF